MKNCKFYFILLLFVAGKVKSQQNFTLYYMPAIPQANLLNPANKPDCKWHVGIPALNSTYLHFTNGAFTLNKIYDAIEHPSADSGVLNLNKLVDVLSKKNYIANKTEISWISGGFKLLKSHYFHLSVQEKIQVRISLPKDLVRFVVDGNGGPNLGETFDFDFKLSALHYREWALGYAYTLDDKLTIGARVKYLQGLNLIETKNASVSVTTSKEDFSYLVNANLNLRTASTIGQIIQTDSNQNFEPKPGNFFKTKNKGMALDLGGSYKVNDRITVNASVLDMGYIRWKQNTLIIRSHDPNASYKFDGVHVSSSDTNSDFGQYLSDVGDTLLKVFKVDTVRGSKFSSGLSAEFFLGASYVFTKRITAGALFYGDFYNKRFYPGLTLNASYKLGKALSLNLSNTIYNRSWLNLGLGGAVNAGAFQVYSVMDNFLFPFMTGSFRSFSWRFGSNITIGRERLRPRKAASDNPGGEPASTDPSRL